MEKIWFAEYQKTGIPETVELPAENTSLVDIFERNFQKFGSRDAFIFMDKVLSFSELEEASRKFATYLQSLGLAPGSRVAVMMPNVLQYPVVALGVLRAGLVLVNVNPLYTSRELEHQLNDSGSEVLVIIENFASVYQAIIGKTPVKHVVVASVGDMLGALKGTLVNFVLRSVRKQIPAWNIPGHIKFNAAISKVSPSNYKRPNLTLSDTAVLQYTGGTTGVSKGAELTHRNLVANMLQCDGIFQSKFGAKDGQPDDRIFCALPLYHILYKRKKLRTNNKMEQEIEIDVMIADASHEVYVDTILDTIESAAKVRGTGIAKRTHEYVAQKMKEGKAVIALAGNEFAGFSYIESWGNKQYVTTSGLIVHPDFRGLGIAKRIKDMTFQLARMRWPKAKIFSLTSGAAVMKMNTELGYVPVTFSDLTDDEAFWRGCNGCVNHDILERTERKYCICTAMLFDPADPHRAQREREARNQTKKD